MTGEMVKIVEEVMMEWTEWLAEGGVQCNVRNIYAPPQYHHRL